MTKSEQTKYIKKLLDKWTKVMHLSNWNYKIVHIKKDDDRKSLTIYPCEIYCNATIDVYPLFWASKKERQNQDIVHELVHCILEPLPVISYDFLDGKFHDREKIIRTVENITQRLATIICPIDRFY